MSRATDLLIVGGGPAGVMTGLLFARAGCHVTVPEKHADFFPSHRPGLLAIGDAAHAMSPIGGIGINLAIQDAVATANILAEPLASGEDVDPLLGPVQRKRLFPTRIIQAGQKAAQEAVIGRVLGGAPITDAPWPVKLLDRYPVLQRIPGLILGLGVRRERVQSPLATP